MKRRAKRRPALRRPNYLKLLMASPEGHDHPIDLAARKRIRADAADKRIVRLHGQVRAQLGKETKAFLALENLRVDLSDKRAEAYFNLGFERGLLEGAARVKRGALSGRGKQLVKELCECIAQAQLPTDQAARVIYAVQGTVLLNALADEHRCFPLRQLPGA